MKDNDKDPEERSFFERFRVPIIVGVVLLVGAALVFAFVGKKPAPKKRSTVSMVNIMPPPPPPTPPPVATPPPPEEPPPDNPQQPEFQPEDAPVEKAPEPDQPPDEAAPMGTDLQGDGPDNGFGLKQGGGGGLIGGKGNGNGGGGGTKWGWYAGKVQTAVASAIRSNRRTRSAAISVKVKVWADESGRVSRATLAGSSGDPAVDQAIREEVLSGLQLPEPPPEGMPMPIVMRITATRP